MNIAVKKLREAGFSIEPDERPGLEGHWIVFLPKSYSASPDPEFFSSEGLVAWYQLLLAIGELPASS
ncbi:MAG: hypothetical protein J0L89_05630 [Xanthomonadales bacterium]|nr:hypothetical protein [Xanthomonadales bacterium]